MVGHKTQGGNGVGLCIVGEAQLYTVYKTDCQQFNAISAGLEGFSGEKIAYIVSGLLQQGDKAGRPLAY